MSIRNVINWAKKCIAILSDNYASLYPPRNSFPWWMPQVAEPTKLNDKNMPNKMLRFNITENVCGLTVNYGVMKIGCISNFVIYDKRGKQIPQNNEDIAWTCQRVNNALVDILRHYNADCVVLQAKVLEKENYYNIIPRIYGFRLYVDGVEQEITDMAYLLRRHNIETVPILGINKTISKETKENYSAQSKIANVNSKGIICINRQKSLSFLL